MKARDLDRLHDLLGDLAGDDLLADRPDLRDAIGELRHLIWEAMP